MFNSNDYHKDREFRARRMREAEREHLAEKITDGSKPDFDVAAALRAHRRLLAAAFVVGLAVILMLVMPHISSAHDRTESGTDEPFANAMTLYRLGHYYFVTEKYDKAVEKIGDAIEAIPEDMFAQSAHYAVMYWDLGEAQLKDGQYNDALTSYQHYVELVGDDASEQVVAYVQQLQDAVANGTVTEVSLITG